MTRSIAINGATGVGAGGRRMLMTALIFVGIVATLAVSSTLLGISPSARPSVGAPPAVVDAWFNDAAPAAGARTGAVDDWFNEAAPAAGARTGAVDDWFNDAAPAIRPPLVDDWFNER